MELGEDEYFLLGDNRESSEDSRFSGIGNIKRENLIGRVWLRFQPFSQTWFRPVAGKDGTITMNIQWYPGHMTKAKRAMKEDVKLVDLVIELVDARAPLSSRNPDIDSLAAGKGRVILFKQGRSRF